ncbi:MAG: hypothetical protein JW881_06390 [Spirochaetales bacterium]|nr:hypothetical protein [Spirochaetales bacterium]
MRKINYRVFFAGLLILSVAAYPDYKDDVRKLIRENTQKDGTIINKDQIHDAIANFSVREREELYTHLRDDPVFPTILNIIPLGLGSLLQGDEKVFYLMVLFMGAGTLCGSYLYFLYPWDDPFGSLCNGLQSVFLFIPAWEMVAAAGFGYIFSLLTPGWTADYRNRELASALKLRKVSVRFTPVADNQKQVFTGNGTAPVSFSIMLSFSFY